LVRDHLSLQVRNGLIAQMILYRCDFLQGPGDAAARLNAVGRRRLDEICRIMLCHCLCPLVIESSGNVELDRARRNSVLSVLTQSQFAVSQDWVVIGESTAGGLAGKEAIVNHLKMLQESAIGGITLVPLSSSGGSGGSGSTGGGSSVVVGASSSGNSQ
jgi:hypothetical protein